MNGPVAARSRPRRRARRGLRLPPGRLAPTRASLAAAALGAAMLSGAAGLAPATWPLAVAGAAAAAVAALTRWPAAGTLAALAAMAAAGAGVAGQAVSAPAAAAEGTLVLAYLLALDLAESGVTAGAARWARRQLPVLAAALGAALLVALASLPHLPPSPWLITAGVAAAGAALLLAAPR